MLAQLCCLSSSRIITIAIVLSSRPHITLIPQATNTPLGCEANNIVTSLPNTLIFNASCMETKKEKVEKVTPSLMSLLVCNFKGVSQRQLNQPLNYDQRYLIKTFNLHKVLMTECNFTTFPLSGKPLHAV